MRGNPFVNLVAILVMLISVLTAGKVWIDWKVSKGESVRKETKLEEFIEKKNEAQLEAEKSFEHLHKRTE